jgi:hypothetical protein
MQQFSSAICLHHKQHHVQDRRQHHDNISSVCISRDTAQLALETRYAGKQFMMSSTRASEPSNTYYYKLNYNTAVAAAMLLP